ncbi:putative hydrolase [Rhypophila decipiens]|uniref:Hydrolase n=1 Tax=Rhypophila decipiens TaxID=261697 RepID=A0AAN6XVK6_9PEZI|nr:putative hydrolase [Rhypophila decipiens]
MSSCCLKGFKWDSKPQGRETTVNGLSCYVAGDNPDVAIMVIHDLYGWTFPNIRLLADHYATEVGVTVYVPDLFGGEVLSPDLINNKAEWDKLDLPSFMARNSKPIRGPQAASFAKFLRTSAGHKHLGAIGYCFGGWVAFQLGAGGDCNPSLVDCIVAAHPTFLTEDEIRAVKVPVQIIAPEVDPIFTEELKAFAQAEIPKLGVPFDYQFFPGLEHGFSVRGNRENEAEMRGLSRAMRAAAGWFREWLV